jgi:hypothetical protein
VVAEHLKVADPEQIAGRPELRQPDLRDRGLVMTVLAWLDLPGASPNSPFVQVTTTVRMPSAEYFASTPPVLDDSSSGCACTAIRVSFAAMAPACPIMGRARATGARPGLRC